MHQQATSPEGWQIQQQAYSNTHEEIVIDEDSSQNIMIFNNYKKTLFSRIRQGVAQNVHALLEHSQPL